jgi:Tol biopolymer transport system component
VTVVVVVGRADRPADVPPGFAPPAALPRATHPLPVNHLLFASDRRGTFGIYAMQNDGQQVRPLVEDPQYQSWGVRLSPDRATAIFYRTPAGETDRDPAAASLWAVAADGGAPVMLRPAGLDGWVVQNHAEWDHYGSALVMSGGSRTNPQIFVTDALGQHPRQLTTRPGVNTDPSYTPDGKEIFFIGCPGETCEQQDREIYRMPAGGGEPVRITTDHRPDRQPYVSPQGNKLAWLSIPGTEAGDGWQIRLADREGEVIDNPRSLLPLSGEDVVGRPQWSLDGSTIYVHRKIAGRATTGIFAISTNSPQGPRELTLGQSGNHEDPSS